MQMPRGRRLTVLALRLAALVATCAGAADICADSEGTVLHEDGTCVLSFSTVHAEHAAAGRAAAGNAAAGRGYPATFPDAILGTVVITQHQVDPSLGYPHALTELEVALNARSQRARVAVVRGAGAGDVYVRDYAGKEEYRLHADGKCERAYLSQPWPAAKLPARTSIVEVESRAWVLEERGSGASAFERVRLESHGDASFVNMCRVEAVAVAVAGSSAQSATPLTTYDLRGVRAETADLRIDLPDPASCAVFYNGWAYIHLLHNFVYI